MTIFTNDLSHRIILFVSLPLFVFQFLPYVTCKQESESVDRNMIFGTISIGMFFSIMIFCCLFYAFYRVALIALEGREVLHARATSGLDKEIIESFPFFLYSEVKGLKIGNGGVECAICLNEFEDQETLRMMPPCSHTFHANCIDVWLSSRSTCPVCRANLSLMKPGESFRYPSMDLETGNAQRGVLESQDDISLISNSVAWTNNANYRAHRSRSTGLLSSWRVAEIFVPRSHSTGHSLVQLGENLDRFTMQLPEEVHRQLVSFNLIRRSHMALPRARSSRQGYRSERSDFISMSLSFSFQAASVRSTLGNDVQETSQARDKDSSEHSFSHHAREGLIYEFFSSFDEDKSHKKVEFDDYGCG